MKVAKIAPAPMVLRTGSRLPISAQVKPPSASTAIIVGASGLISALRGQDRQQDRQDEIDRQGMMPILMSTSRHQPSGQNRRAGISAAGTGSAGSGGSWVRHRYSPVGRSPFGPA